MNTVQPSNHSGPVVVGVDGSAGSDVAVVYAAGHAARHRLPLRIVHAVGDPVIPDFPVELDATRTVLRQLGREIVEGAAALARQHGPDVEVTTVLEMGDPRAVLLDEAEEASTVVVGSRGSGVVAGLLLGSVGVAVTAHAPTTVVVARPSVSELDESAPVVVGFDGTAVSSAAVHAAYDLASWQHRPLEIVHALGDPLTFPYYRALTDEQVRDVRTDAELRIAQATAGQAEQYPDVPVHVSVVLDSPGHVLRTASETAYALVVGSRGRGSLARRLLGSVSRSVVEHARCTVLVVPADRT